MLDNIKYARATCVDQLNSLLVDLTSLMMEEAFALVIVDSIMGPFRVDFSGRGELADR